MTVAVPIACPFPDVADHVEQAVAIGWELPYRGGLLISIGEQILPRELALPCVGHLLAAGSELFSPSVSCTIESTPRGKLPFHLGWQFFSYPFGICRSIFISDVNNWMLSPILN